MPVDKPSRQQSPAAVEEHSLADTLKADPLMSAVSERFPMQWTRFVGQLRALLLTQAPVKRQHELVAEFRASLTPQLRELTARMPNHLLSEFFAVKGDTYAFHAEHSPQKCERAMHAGLEGRRIMQQMFRSLPQDLRNRHVQIMVKVIRETNNGSASVQTAPAFDATIDAALQSEHEPENSCAAFAARIERIQTLDPARAGWVYRSFLPGVVPTVYRVPANVRVMRDGQTITVSGRLGHGTSERLRSVLSGLDAPSTVLLDSEGGLLSEGQRIAQTIAQLDLDTRVENSCASACTIAFLAGRQRLANADAMIGFHQAGTTKAMGTVSYLYRSVADYRRLYTHQAITDDFLARVARTPSVEVWYPRHEELVRNGIVTDVIMHSFDQPSTKRSYSSARNTLNRERMAQRLLGLAPVQSFARRYPVEWQEEKERLDDLIDNGVGIERLGRFSLARVFGRYHALRRHAPDALVTDAIRFLHQRISDALEQDSLRARSCSFRFLNSAANRSVDWQQAIVAGVIATAKPNEFENSADGSAFSNQAWELLRNQLADKDWRTAWAIETTHPTPSSLRAQCVARLSLLEALLALPREQSDAAARRLWIRWM